MASVVLVSFFLPFSPEELYRQHRISFCGRWIFFCVYVEGGLY